MTDTEINLKIAHFMKLMPMFNVELPDYCHDLNAVWEVEERLKEKELMLKYIAVLMGIVYAGSAIDICHASALDRCRAIIKVLEDIK